LLFFSSKNKGKRTFFFEKKKQKTFVRWVGGACGGRARGRLEPAGAVLAMTAMHTRATGWGGEVS
jgi:hypothetical protein